MKTKLTRNQLIELLKKQQEMIHKYQEMLELSDKTIKGLSRIIDNMAEAIRRHG